MGVPEVTSHRAYIDSKQDIYRDPDNVRFVREPELELLDTPEVDPRLGRDYLKLCVNVSDSYHAELLLASHFKASARISNDRYGEATDAQLNHFITYSHDTSGAFCKRDEGWIGRSVEVSMHKSQIEPRVMDIEDLCAISRVGEEAVYQAQVRARIMIDRGEMELPREGASVMDFEVYSQAERSNGSRIIPYAEEVFVRQWLAYYYKDISELEPPKDIIIPSVGSLNSLKAL
jgi:hypothetical protein